MITAAITVNNIEDVCECVCACVCVWGGGGTTTPSSFRVIFQTCDTIN